jgi:hypothetical protein
MPLAKIGTFPHTVHLIVGSMTLVPVGVKDPMVPRDSLESLTGLRQRQWLLFDCQLELPHILL